jgi:hypothetical protein
VWRRKSKLKNTDEKSMLENTGDDITDNKNKHDNAKRN